MKIATALIVGLLMTIGILWFEDHYKINYPSGNLRKIDHIFWTLNGIIIMGIVGTDKSKKSI